MTVTTLITTRTTVSTSPDRVGLAAGRLYDAEFALHAARETHVDAWIAAAYDKLHLAILEHSAASHRTTPDAHAA
jgi:hypothetical protein